jgi:transcription initiation factor TFIIH subunit 2
VNSSGDEAGAHTVSRRGAGGHKGARPPSSKPKKVQKKEAWEDIKRSWDNVVEGADGSINVTGLLEAGKRKRYFFLHPE